MGGAPKAIVDSATKIAKDSLDLSDKVPGTLGTRNGNEERGTSVKATWNVEGYTADRRSFDAWNVFPTI
jgi:hypothetical protein